MSWEGWVATLVFVLGVAALRFVDDPIRRPIALALWAAGFCAVVLLTWDRDPE